VSNLVLGEGRGFEIAQGRLGPGRVHHCMRAIGMGERALQKLLQRATDGARRPFGKTLAEHAPVQMDIAECRTDLDAARLLVLHTAGLIDRLGAKGARKEIAMIKVFVPRAVLQVFDRAIQVHGGAGVSEDTFLARGWAGLRTLRIADGPDVVHTRTLAMLTLRDHARAKM
jgi:alkylation response protein AidB-like acyl-CoA dehydrogenase